MPGWGGLKDKKHGLEPGKREEERGKILYRKRRRKAIVKEKIMKSSYFKKVYFYEDKWCDFICT